MENLEFWIAALPPYKIPQLCAKPSADAWSMGQLYLHLITDTRFYLEQAKDCLCSNEHTSELASPFAQKIFIENSFPDEVIAGAASNAQVSQPESKEQLVNDLLLLKVELQLLMELAAASTYTGKTKHPGLGYFNSREWLQFADLHFRHHVRQKKRIDEFLKMIV